jgi:hypothetical protein
MGNIHHSEVFSYAEHFTVLPECGVSHNRIINIFDKLSSSKIPVGAAERVFTVDIHTS